MAAAAHHVRTHVHPPHFCSGSGLPVDVVCLHHIKLGRVRCGVVIVFVVGVQSLDNHLQLAITVEVGKFCVVRNVMAGHVIAVSVVD